MQSWLHSGRHLRSVSASIASICTRAIQHGYTVESAQHLSADRLLLTGEGQQLAEQQAALTRLNPHTKDIAIYTPDALQVIEQQQGLDNGAGIANESHDSGLTNMPEPALAEIEFGDSAWDSEHDEFAEGMNL